MVERQLRDLEKRFPTGKRNSTSSRSTSSKNYNFILVIMGSGRIWNYLLLDTSGNEIGIPPRYYFPLKELEILHKPAVHGAMGCGKKIFKLVWRCHQLLSWFLAKGHLPRVSRQSRL